MANYSLGRIPMPEPENGHAFDGDNFIQLTPTAIFVGVTGLTFKNCNLTNCILPGDAVTLSHHPQMASFCSHVHPKWVAKGLTECVENCTHVIDTDAVTIDGQVVDTIYHYMDARID